MGKQNNTVLIIGEGITEFYYFNSLKDLFQNIQIKPEYPKHTSLTELRKKIEDGIEDGYAKIYCVIDMDNKGNNKEGTKYNQLKSKYTAMSKKIDKNKSEVIFIETHRCTELFFLFYFYYTHKEYVTQEDLLTDLRKYCEYKKNKEFFRKCKGLHTYFEKNGGKLADAIKNANHSCEEQKLNMTNHTYSEIGRLIQELGYKSENNV